MLAGSADDGDESKLRAREAADPIHRAVAEQVDQLVEWDRAVRADVYDSVHQMRVTTRKIRSLLQSSEGAFGISGDAWILDELRQLASVLGVARDAEVLAERYERALDDLPGRPRPRADPEAVGRRRQAALQVRAAAVVDRHALGAILPPARRARRAGGRRAAVDSGGRRAGRASPSTRPTSACAKPRRTPPDAADEDRDEALHRIRKGAKRLRYTAAATGADKVSDRAKNIQSLLGDHQDSVVSRTHLSQQAEAAHAAGEDTFTYGLLYAQEDELAQSSRRQLDGALKKLGKSVRKAR